jgi:hypothetical protein
MWWPHFVVSAVTYNLALFPQQVSSHPHDERSLKQSCAGDPYVASHSHPSIGSSNFICIWPSFVGSRRRTNVSLEPDFWRGVTYVYRVRNTASPAELCRLNVCTNIACHGTSSAQPLVARTTASPASCLQGPLSRLPAFSLPMVAPEFMSSDKRCWVV